LAETNAFEMHLTDEKTCRITRRNYRSRSFWSKRERKRRLIFTLDHQATFRLWLMLTIVNCVKISNCFCARGFQNNEFDNQEIVLKSLNFVLNVHSYWVIPLTHICIRRAHGRKSWKVLSFFTIYY
jgi:hypothetical protein